MIFRDLKAGFPIYLFDRASRKFKQGKVTSNPCPDFENGKQNVMAAMHGMPNYGAKNVKVNVQTDDGKLYVYSVVDTEQTAYSDTLVISCSKENIINEVNALKNQANDILGKMPDFEQTVKDCDKLLSELDTSFRDKLETNERLDRLESKFDEFAKKILKSQKQE